MSTFSAKSLADDASNPYSIGNEDRKYDLLYAGAFTASELRIAGASIAQLKSVVEGVSRTFSDDEIIKAGFPVEDLKNAGYSLDQVISGISDAANNAGVTEDEWKNDIALHYGNDETAAEWMQKKFEPKHLVHMEPEQASGVVTKVEPWRMQFGLDTNSTTSMSDTMNSAAIKQLDGTSAELSELTQYVKTEGAIVLSNAGSSSVRTMKYTGFSSNTFSGLSDAVSVSVEAVEDGPVPAVHLYNGATWETKDIANHDQMNRGEIITASFADSSYTHVAFSSPSITNGLMAKIEVNDQPLQNNQVTLNTPEAAIVDGIVAETMDVEITIKDKETGTDLPHVWIKWANQWVDMGRMNDVMSNSNNVYTATMDVGSQIKIKKARSGDPDIVFNVKVNGGDIMRDVDVGHGDGFASTVYSGEPLNSSDVSNVLDNLIYDTGLETSFMCLQSESVDTLSVNLRLYNGAWVKLHHPCAGEANGQHSRMLLRETYGDVGGARDAPPQRRGAALAAPSG